MRRFRAHPGQHIKKEMLALVLVLACLWLPSSAKAQSGTPDPTAFQLQQFRPWQDPYGMLQTQSAETMGQWKYLVGIIFNYANVPLRVLDQQNGQNVAELVSHQIAADLNLGIGFANWFDLQVQLPLTLYQLGRFPNDPGFGSLSGVDVSGFFLGDVKIGLKFAFLSEKAQGVGLGLQLWVGLPTAQIGPRKAFNGEEAVPFGATLLFNKTVSIATFGVNFGYRFLPKTEFLALTINHEFTYSVSLALELAKNRFDLIFDIAGATSFVENVKIQAAPLDVYVGGRIYPLNSKNFAITIGGAGPITQGYGSPLFRVFLGFAYSPRTQDTDGDGLMDPEDRCPKVKGPRENNGCPWPDTDGDGLLDKDDRCPRVPGPKENKGCPYDDFDGDGLKDNVDKCPKKPGPRANKGCPWPDTDGDGIYDHLDKCPKRFGPRANKGCPWPDTDGDGLIDPKDKCPKKAGPISNKGCPLLDTDGDGLLDKDDKCPTQAGPASNKGCPLVIINKKVKRIYILKKIFFDTNKATIKPESFPVLDAVANILSKNKNIYVRVEGHTDDVGGDSYNQKLSTRRAKSVRRYLVRKGIPANRLSFKGYGESKPLEGRRGSFTREQRAKNRRVEFHITQQ